MIKVTVTKHGNYPVNSTKIKKALKEILGKNGIVSDSLVEIIVIGEKPMMDLAKKYLGEKNILHNVLSFPESEIRGEFKYPDTQILRLGQIYLCYPKIVGEANTENKLIDEKAVELIEHAALHLLGIHHK